MSCKSEKTESSLIFNNDCFDFKSYGTRRSLVKFSLFFLHFLQVCEMQKKPKIPPPKKKEEVEEEKEEEKKKKESEEERQKEKESNTNR
jgi:hypothetical protein